MNDANLSWITNFIWNIADDVLRDVYVRGKYRYFYNPQPLRTLEEIRADIEALEKETDGLLGQILIDTEGGV